ncbi:MAG TPA: hypothetical protein PLN33_04325 [Hyphomonadaceae bacterium]|jgi:hypothetical protein|nr:hypothetical protein [Hyphomonadaceae bacterium]HPN06899.1 hypothetical protein [Hyphomonadaceae bacterium]
MIRTGIFASIALAAFIDLPATAQIGVGGSGSATIDTRPVTDTARGTADKAHGAAHATVDTAKQKSAEASAKAKAAKPDVKVGASSSTSAGAGANSNGVSAGASNSTSAGASVNN